jgi:hypothetical protein
MVPAISEQAQHAPLPFFFFANQASAIAFMFTAVNDCHDVRTSHCFSTLIIKFPPPFK